MTRKRYPSKAPERDPAAPCGTCPYRRSTPLGVWDRSEYDKLCKWDAVDPCEVVARAVPGTEVSLRDIVGVCYNCHLADGTICRGWLADQKRRGIPSLALRIRLMRDPKLFQTLERVDADDPDLYGSVAEMCAANAGKKFPVGNPKARKLLRLKQRGRRRR